METVVIGLTGDERLALLERLTGTLGFGGVSPDKNTQVISLIERLHSERQVLFTVDECEDLVQFLTRHTENMESDQGLLKLLRKKLMRG